MLVEIIVFIITSIVAYYMYVYKKIHYYYETRGIKYLSGVPVFGNIMKSTFAKAHVWEDFDEVYRAFPDEKYVGFIEGTTPTILIREPELIKKLTIKDFDHFVNHKKFFPDDAGTMFGDSLLMLKGLIYKIEALSPLAVDQAMTRFLLGDSTDPTPRAIKWRDMRTTLSPAFTSSKMRLMVPFMVDISNNIIEYLRGHTSEDIDVYDLIRRYTNDVIASAGFGLQVNSLIDTNNAFYKYGQTVLNLSLTQKVHLMIYTQFPALAKKIALQIVPAETENFFRDIVSNTLDYRFKNNIERPDMIQLLMEASKGTLIQINNEDNSQDVSRLSTESTQKVTDTERKWSDNELAAQVFIFFIAGFETTANALIMCIHELALNPDIQEILYQEIRSYNEIKGSFQYASLNQLKYLDCVINEASRKWSAAIVIDRVCTKSYDLPPPRDGAKPYRIKPGDLVYNAANSIQMDPKFYRDPVKFDPYRFSDDNKHQIKTATFTPFGIGPRNCIGARFANLEIKVLLYYLVLKFKIVKCKKTTDPIKLQPSEFNMIAFGGTWVKFDTRDY